MGNIRIAVMSDLHLEFDLEWRHRLESLARRDPTAARTLERLKERVAEPDHPDRGPDLREAKAAGVDCALLAGDIDIGIRSIAYADAVARYLDCRVLMCAGNHEAYRHNLVKLTGDCRTNAASTEGRVVFLERDRFDIVARGLRVSILGATLWTDYALDNDVRSAMYRALNGLRDHKRIRFERAAFSPTHALAIHRGTREWLCAEATFARQEADRVVIMTHHAPTPDALCPARRGDGLAPAYASDMRAEIAGWRPDLWIWGHTHHATRTVSGTTRLASAPRGYIGFEPGAEEFLPAIIEL